MLHKLCFQSTERFKIFQQLCSKLWLSRKLEARHIYCLMFTASHLFRFTTSLPVEFLCFNMRPWEPLNESKPLTQQGILMCSYSYWKGINGLVCTPPYKVPADLNNSLDSPDVRVNGYWIKDQASDICLSWNSQTGFSSYEAWLYENHTENLTWFYCSPLILR